MAYNEELADKIRKVLAKEKVEEKKMFGGIAFMVNGKMCVCVGGYHADDFMIRVGPEMYEGALKKKGAQPATMKGREIKGYIKLINEGIESNKDFHDWIKLALEFNKTLKQSKSK